MASWSVHDMGELTSRLVLTPHMVELQQQLVILKDNMFQLQEREEKEGRGQTREDWLMLGDSNIKFFGKKTKERSIRK